MISDTNIPPYNEKIENYLDSLKESWEKSNIKKIKKANTPPKEGVI